MVCVVVVDVSIVVKISIDRSIFSHRWSRRRSWWRWPRRQRSVRLFPHCSDRILLSNQVAVLVEEKWLSNHIVIPVCQSFSVDERIHILIFIRSIHCSIKRWWYVIDEKYGQWWKCLWWKTDQCRCMRLNLSNKSVNISFAGWKSRENRISCMESLSIETGRSHSQWCWQYSYGSRYKSPLSWCC